MSRTSWTHPLALLRGAAEGEDIRYFRSLLHLHTHAAPLLAAGLVVRADVDHPTCLAYTATGRGARFHAQHLAGTPTTKANYWDREPALVAAAAELARWCEGEELSTARSAAHLRGLLRAAFPGEAFTVRSGRAGGRAAREITVAWSGGPAEEQVADVARPLLPGPDRRPVGRVRIGGADLPVTPAVRAVRLIRG
ncbi:LPD29 domain-containing protein [Streptacidiphilus sp. EB103A]|uniref:LPD29 domain-containing protein n=1 Tax=Streptacidiphilus sp. EB103A TaxID=3156275 RepID=UPI003516266E